MKLTKTEALKRLTRRKRIKKLRKEIKQLNRREDVAALEVERAKKALLIAEIKLDDIWNRASIKSETLRILAEIDYQAKKERENHDRFSYSILD